MITRHLPLLAILLLAPIFLFSQITNNLQTPTSVNEDGSAPDASAILDVNSDSLGLLMPRMTSAERDASILVLMKVPMIREWAV